MDNNGSNFVGKYLKQQREKLGKTVREMASELGVMPIYISDIEKGNRLPDIELLQLMKEKFGIENDACIEFLLNRQEKKNKVSHVKNDIPKVVICYDRDKKNM